MSCSRQGIWCCVVLALTFFGPTVSAQVLQISAETQEVLKSVDVHVAKQNYDEAIKTLEPALTREPKNASFQSRMASLEWLRGSQPIGSKPGGNQNFVQAAENATPAEVQEALQHMRKALGWWQKSFERIQDSKPSAEQLKAELFEIQKYGYTDQNALQQLRLLKGQPPEVQKAVDEFREQVQNHLWVQIQFFAQLIEKEPTQFPLFSNHVRNEFHRFGTSGAHGRNPAFQVRRAILLWLETREKIGDVRLSLTDLRQVNDTLENVTAWLTSKPNPNDVDTDVESRPAAATELFTALQKSRNSAWRDFGQVGLSWQKVLRGEITFEQYRAEYDKLKERWPATIKEPPGKMPRHTQWEQYFVWRYAVHQHPGNDLGSATVAFTEWRENETLAMTDLMLSRKELINEIVDRLVSVGNTQSSQMIPPKEIERRLAGVLASLDDPKLIDFEDNANLINRRQSWLKAQTDWLFKFPEIAGDRLKAPWKSAKKLLAITESPFRSKLEGGTIHDGAVYCLRRDAAFAPRNQATLTLLKLPLKDGDPTEVASIVLEGAVGNFGISYPGRSISNIAFGSKECCCNVPGFGLVIFGLDDKTPSHFVKLDQNLPYKDVQGLALVDRKLYLGLGGQGALVEYSLETGDYKPLLSGDWAENPAAFKDIQRLQVFAMLHDTERKRLVFGVTAHKVTGTNTFTFLPQSGLWEWNLGTTEFKQLHPFNGTAPNWVSFIDANSLLLWARDYLLKFDHTNNRLQYLQTAGGRPLNQQLTPTIQTARGLLSTQLIFHRDWIWTGDPLVRTSVKTGKTEPLPPLERPNAPLRQLSCLLLQQTDQGRQIVFGTEQSVWLLQMDEATPKP